MKRNWFHADDGTYFRNCPLIMAEIDRARVRPWLWHRIRGLYAEWYRTFDKGVIRKDQLGRGDQDAGKPAPMREAYPGNPGLWVLDDPEFPRPLAPVIAESYLGDPDLGDAAAEWLRQHREGER